MVLMSFYLPRTLVNQDILLGEDTLSKFDSAHSIEMYMEAMRVLLVKKKLLISLV